MGLFTRLRHSVLSLSGIGDFNHDGKPDVAISNSGNPFVAVYLGKGDGTFETGVNYFVGVGPNTSQIGPAVADFNGDGKADVGSNNVLLFGKGDGTLQGNLLASSFIQSNSTIDSWVSADFNHDGDADVALIMNSGGDTTVLEVYLGDGTGQLAFQGFGDTWTPGSIPTLVTGDFNGDGKPDLLAVGVVSGQGGWQSRLYLGNGDGTFAAPVISTPQEQTSEPVPIVVADFNGDHISDFAAISSVGIRIYLGQSNGTFAGPTFVTMADNSTPNSFVAGDFNGDGKIDIAATTQGAVNILLGKGDGTFQPAVAKAVSFPQGSFGYLAGAVDTNGDGNLDLIIGGLSAAAGPGGLDVNADVLPGNGDGTFGALITNSFTVSQKLNAVGIGDINGDGIPDLVTSNTSGLQIALGNGDGTFGAANTLLPPSLQSFGGLQPNILVQDFNGDTRPDIVVFEAAGNSGISVLLNRVPAAGPNFNLTAKALQPATVAPGSSGTSAVTVIAVGGFTEAVALSCTGLPTGATCKFAPASIANGSGSSTLTIAVSSTTAVGTYPIEISGTSSSTVHRQSLTLTVGTVTPVTTVTVTPQTLMFAAAPTGTASSAERDADE